MLSLYLRNKLLDHMHGKAAFTMPTVYLGYSTTAPNASDGNVTEPTGNGYARVQAPASSWTSASAGAITNSADIVFPTASGSWGTVTHVVAYDALTSGNLLWSDDITSQSVPAGVQPRIPAGDADSTLS